MESRHDDAPVPAVRRRVTYTDPQAAAVAAAYAAYTGTALVSEVPTTATYTRAYAKSNGFLTLLSDGQRLTGACAPRARSRRVDGFTPPAS